MAFKPRSGNNNSYYGANIGSDVEKNLRAKSIIELFDEYFKILNYFETQGNKGVGDITMPGIFHTTLSLDKIILEKIEQNNYLESLKKYKNTLENILEGFNYSSEVKDRLQNILNKMNSKISILETKSLVQEEVKELLVA